MEKAILKQSSPKTAMDDAAAALQADIDQYNQQVR